MHFSGFTEYATYMKASVRPPLTTGLLKGVRRAFSCSINPGIFPNPELIWYIESLKIGEKISWIIDSKSTGTFKEIDLDCLAREVRSFNRKNPIDYEEGKNMPMFGKYCRDDFQSYNDMLTTFEWHKRRFELFTKHKFQCKICQKKATVKFFTRSHGSQPTFNIERFSNADTEKIVKAISYFRSFSLPQLQGLLFEKWKQVDPITLQLHHTYYLVDKKPWEYNDDCFQTLCETCHKKVHINDRIPIYFEYESQVDLINLDVVPCSRCDGAGYIPIYNHVQNGICFNCWGDGYVIK